MLCRAFCDHQQQSNKKSGKKRIIVENYSNHPSIQSFIDNDKKEQENIRQSDQTLLDENNAGTQEYFNESMEESKMSYPVNVPFKNLGKTCYINSSLQAVRLMAFYQSDFLYNRNGEFHGQLRKIFQNSDSDTLCDIVKKFKQTHNNQEGGDSYITLLQILQEIKQEDRQTSRSYKLQIGEGYYCNSCRLFVENSHSQESSMEIDSINQLLEDNPSKYKEKHESQYSSLVNSSLDHNQEQMVRNEECTECKNNREFKRIVLNNHPTFFIIKFRKPMNGNLKYQLELKNSKSNSVYRLIGFCSFISLYKHYIFSGCYNDKWYSFNDSKVKKIKNSSIPKGVLYLIYKLKPSEIQIQKTS